MTKSEEAMATLEMIEEAVAKSAGSYDEMRKRADTLYDQRVMDIAKERGCSASVAHGLAASDDVASRAYELSAELAERQSNSLLKGGRIAAYLD